LYADVDVDGIDDAEFQTIAEKVSKGCPISRALAATEINLSARLTKAKTAG
jgi:organic hydroperoxide reductase OsmC/OhrA